MLAFPAAIRIFLAVQPVDMRKSFNGLWSAVGGNWQEEPKSGAVFAFINLVGNISGKRIMIHVFAVDREAGRCTTGSMKEKKLAGLCPFDLFESLAKALVTIPKDEVATKARETHQPKKTAPKAKRKLRG
jgi:hypothetical protein